MARPFSSMLAELRGGLEFAQAFGSDLTAGLPHGDGRGVMLIPGLWGGDTSLFILRRELARLGYDARTWGLGLNNRCGESTVQRVAGKVAQMAERHSAPVSLIGHSRGGFVAREVARRMSTMVDAVVTLGTPLRLPALEDASPMVRVLLRVSRTLYAENANCMTEHCDCPYMRDFDRSL